MSRNVYDILEERGFIAQTTHEELRDLLGKEKVTFYIGFDATAESRSPSDRSAGRRNYNDWRSVRKI